MEGKDTVKMDQECQATGVDPESSTGPEASADGRKIMTDGE